MTDVLVPLCQLDEIPESGSRGLRCGEHKLFAVKYRGKVFVYRNSCPHLGISLDWVEHQFLDSSGTMIQCANHGALFVIKSGQCVAGPCAGRKLQAIPFQIDNNTLFINPSQLNH